MFENYLNYLYPIIGIGGGIVLIITSLRRKAAGAVWPRIAFCLAGSSAIIWATLIIIQLSHIVGSNTIAGRLIQSCKLFIGGIGAGILITLFLSGELSFSKKKP
jgi:hypothetical protein